MKGSAETEKSDVFGIRGKGGECHGLSHPSMYISGARRELSLFFPKTRNYGR